MVADWSSKNWQYYVEKSKKLECWFLFRDWTEIIRAAEVKAAIPKHGWIRIMQCMNTIQSWWWGSQEPEQTKEACCVKNALELGLVAG